MNLHRNVFFKDCAKVPPQPFSALEASYPVDLWNWMDAQRKAGNELLAASPIIVCSAATAMLVSILMRRLQSRRNGAYKAGKPAE